LFALFSFVKHIITLFSPVIRSLFRYLLCFLTKKNPSENSKGFDISAFI
jgi:hypothetical protein